MLSLGKEIMIFDGGMGSELVKAGISYTVPEDLNITDPIAIRNIHKSYCAADFITTNTFGLNKIKYKGSYQISEIAEKAIENARFEGKKVFFDIGPTGALLKPMGTLSFDEAYEAYKEVVLASRDKADGYIIETFSDLYELKSAILAVKENSDKPVFATMTFDKNGRTLTGTTPEIMVDFLEGLGVSALGVNCSLGPNELYPVIERILKASSTPVIIQPNRGLPKFENGRSYYDLTVEEFTESVGKFTEMGVSVIGGCCGTDPDFITSIARFKGNPVALTEAVKKNGIASYSKYIEIDDTASIEDYSVSDDVSEDDLDDIAFEIMDIADDGADAIKLIAENTDVGTFSALCRKIQEYSNVPLILSGNAEIIEEAVRYYNGVAVIELIEDGTEALTDLAKRYGAKLFVSKENKGLLDKITFSDKRTVIS